MNKSKDAARYGRLAEEAACRKYKCSIEHSSWHDVRYRNGKPADVKSSLYATKNGTPGRFRLWKDAHEKLKQAGGGYIFAVLDRDSGRVKKIIRLSASGIDPFISSWSNSGHSKRDEKQTKISWTKIMSI